jgi:hypothetical protein
MPRIVCPSCRKKLHPPEDLAGRRVMCPRCDAVIAVPTELVKAVEEAEKKGTATGETTSPNEDLPFPAAARLGITAMVLGMVSIFSLCLPLFGYLAIGLSSIGLLLGLGGLYRARTEGESLPPAIAGGVGIWGGFGTRVRDYPLGGVAVCLLALLFASLPLLIQWLTEQWS